MKNKLLSGLNRAVNTVGMKAKKYSPELLMGVGLVCGGVATVMACKATLKVNEVLENAKDTIDLIHQTEELKEIETKDDRVVQYTKEDATKDLVKVYASTGIELAKLYGPSIALGTVSLTCIFASNNILRKRNIALAAAYTAVDKGFREYRDRVVERFGEGVDKELKYNLKAAKLKQMLK